MKEARARLRAAAAAGVGVPLGSAVVRAGREKRTAATASMAPPKVVAIAAGPFHQWVVARRRMCG
ncbi:Uncharacterised protein [Dermatophilus congolensis]|uniref:Uncharacterized protein n=1 Tax=Dermatophilus congolensis TaxID=1863 RepID=A0AA46BQA9_9MICO|nr:Uncharacterised protein [Dermatophilus congolensis]